MEAELADFRRHDCCTVYKRKLKEAKAQLAMLHKLLDEHTCLKAKRAVPSSLAGE